MRAPATFFLQLVGDRHHNIESGPSQQAKKVEDQQQPGLYLPCWCPLLAGTFILFRTYFSSPPLLLRGEVQRDWGYQQEDTSWVGTIRVAVDLLPFWFVGWCHSQFYAIHLLRSWW